MARIPTEELNRLKTEVSIQRLVETTGIHLKQHGQDRIGLCPFHDDKEPSLVITPAKNLWHCLGACQTGGTVIDWVMKKEGVSFRHAVELLRADYQPSQTTERVKHSRTKKLNLSIEPDADDNALMMQVIDYYHNSLKDHADALAYLKKRGIEHDAIDHFKLGFVDRTLGYRLPEKRWKAGAAIRGQLQRLGLYRANGHEHFRGGLVIPIINDHQVLEIYGRKITNKVKAGTPLHLYLPGPHQGIFNLEAFAASKEIILCESLIDALTFWCAGFRNVTASYGCEGFTSYHINAFHDQGIERVLIAYDRDEAGNKAADKVKDTLIKMGIDCYRVLFPKGMDANEYALSVTPANKSLGLVIRKAEWMGKGNPKILPTTEVVETKIELIPRPEKNIPEKLITQLKEICAPVNPEVPLPATVSPEPPKEIVDADINDDDITITFGDRRYRIRGLKKNQSYDALKINLFVSNDKGLHVDTFDFYGARPRANFIKQASVELGLSDDIIKKDLSQVLLKLEALQDEQIKALTKPKDETVLLQQDETDAALALLNAPDLLQRILHDFNACGVVGEETNKLVGYLAAVSRKLEKPLAILIQSTSAAGKSSLMDAVLNMIPKEEKVQYSAMTGQSLFYMGETNLKHKILAISEEEGASNAAYALKLLQSEGELTIASTGKDETTGTLVTKEYHVEGPVMIFSTTTAIDIDEELLNRCLVLTVDEDREQTQAIHQLQRKRRTLEGLLEKTKQKDLLALHQNAQRLLKSLPVVNPFAEHLTFLSDRTRTRRDHEKYLTLIDVIALLHQYQRPMKTLHQGDNIIEYIEVTLEDITIANQLAHEVLGRSLDELPPQTRKLLKRIDTMVTQHCEKQTLQRSHYHFSRKTIRDFTRWGNTQLKLHLQRLEDMEYLLIHRGGGRGQQLLYELLYNGEGQEGTPFMMQLIDVKQLKCMYDAKKSGQNSKKSPLSRPQVGGKSALSRGSKNAEKPLNNSVSGDLSLKTEKKDYIAKKKKAVSYVHDAP